MSGNPGNNTDKTNNQPQFNILRLYLQDASFESPDSPNIFRKEWKPTLDLVLNTEAKKVEPDIYEVVVSVTATAKIEDKIAFLVEVKQAGIFAIKSFPNDQISPMLGIVCPSILFPYVREAVSDLVVRGSFPQLNLDPVNFEALYVSKLEQAKKEKNASTSPDEEEKTH
jgi:preprotein translocase subunit SecB